jgi:hypothetical protein
MTDFSIYHFVVGLMRCVREFAGHLFEGNELVLEVCVDE